MSKHDVVRITDAIDCEALAASVGVKGRSIRLARERGVFPSSWFLRVREMCDASGIDCPEDAFNWKSNEGADA